MIIQNEADSEAGLISALESVTQESTTTPEIVPYIISFIYLWVKSQNLWTPIVDRSCTSCVVPI